ncbi:unnamed protein product [Leptosia nina]|uniref:Pro-resilin n=1 Tax=Leptosia nina TaxID=320188 RepID=A0AAV1JI29_9NEOP
MQNKLPNMADILVRDMLYGNTMAHSRIILVTALISFTLQVTTSAKNNASPVYEVINEQSRMDDIRLSNARATLPYGNPLAGNSAQNARLYASNQQAMFNAEKIRQHKAQLQRQRQGPPIVDSYMKAYHESQESHQLALEEQQSNIKDTVSTTIAPRKPLRNRTQNRHRISNRERSMPNNQRQELKSRPEIVEREGSIRTTSKERTRNHRSYESTEYEQYLQSKLPLAYLAGTESEQGITIKPNGNIGVAKDQEKQPTILYTSVISNNGKYLPKTSPEIYALESILKKNPNEQLTEFKTLINSDDSQHFSMSQSPETHDEFYYPLKDASNLNIPNYYNDAFAKIPTTYASAYAAKDHTPITEEVDDVENPIQYQNTFVTPQLTTDLPIEQSTVTKNYYKVEVASQSVTGLKPSKINEELYLNQEQYPSESYITHGGVQHLTEDSTGVSAYGDDVSIKLRFKRSTLDTEPFLIPASNCTNNTETSNTTSTSEIPIAEALRRPLNSKRNDFNVFLTPTFQVGEATDYDDYDDVPAVRPAPKHQPFYDDDEYYDDFSNDYGESNNGPISLTEQPLQNTQIHYPVLDSRGSYSHRHRQFRRPQPELYGLPSSSYGVPATYSSQTYSPHSQILPAVNNLVPNVLEPVYMLTQSQLKQLIGQPNLNIEHLDVYQVSKEKKKVHYPRKLRKRYPYRRKNVRSKLHKLHKLRLLHYAANYEFGYRVRDPESGNYFGQYETKAGERTNGHYHVLLPDGRMQKVQYYAGPSGYHADISYDHLEAKLR